MKVLLVPDLVGLYLPLVALSQSRNKIGQVLRVSRRTINVEIGITRPGPLRSGNHTEEDLDACPGAAIDQAVHLTPFDVASGRLKVLPPNLLLDPAETQVLDGVYDGRVVLINEMRLDAVVETATCKCRRFWFGGRCRLGHRSGCRCWWRSGGRH